MSVMEHSHRGKAYEAVHNEAIALVKELLAVPAQAGAETRLVAQKKKAALAVQHVLDRGLAISVCQRLFDVCIACWVPPLSTDTGAGPALAWSEAAYWALDELIRMAIEDRASLGA